MNKEERIELFKRELSYLEDAKIREFVEHMIEEADEYFFTMPASTSGKYHPDFARGEGGLVRHTKAVAYFCNELVRAELVAGSIDRHKGDLIIAASIVHDIKKMGNGTTGHTVKEHPFYASEYAVGINEKYGLLSEEDMCFVYNCILSHMGPWCDPKPRNLEERLVFYADYMASREQIVGLKFIDSNDNSEVIPIPDPAVKPTIDTYRFDFGKLNGQTLEEAFKNDIDYIRWIANKKDFNKKEAQDLVIEYAKANNIVL